VVERVDHVDDEERVMRSLTRRLRLLPGASAEKRRLARCRRATGAGTASLLVGVGIVQAVAAARRCPIPSFGWWHG
jgi:hypothetical protein